MSATERVYVKVTTSFDQTGFMVPRVLTWSDGRTFPIDEVRSFRPSSVLDASLPGDCYTVVIRGEEKLLFFELTDRKMNPSRFGRWFVLRKPASA